MNKKVDKIYLCKVEFVNLVEKYNSINVENNQYNEGIKKGIEEGIRSLAKTLDIKISFNGKIVSYQTIPLYEQEVR